ncbi:MAG: hypothetical protein Q6370_025420 [Candidatus Sigynarchaeota archaeon]
MTRGQVWIHAPACHETRRQGTVPGRNSAMFANSKQSHFSTLLHLPRPSRVAGCLVSRVAGDGAGSGGSAGKRGD